MRFVRLVGTVAIAGHNLHAQADSATFWRSKPDSTARLALSVSGGISLGSYQSGLNWGLVEYVRLVHDSAEFRKARGLPDLQLSAMSGASAGNINALLSGIHWCAAPGLTRPEDSPYWKTWVDVGWRQLMPNGARVSSEQLGLAERTFFDTVLFPRVDTILHHARSRDKCSVNVGITLTRQLATPLALNRYIKPLVQRHVATYVVRGRLNGDGYEITQADSIVRHDPSLGMQIAVATGARSRIGIRDLASLTEASMALPYVFAPVVIRHYPAKDLVLDGRCPPDPVHGDQCRTPVSARFVDGGAFDNNPLFVALRLLNLSVPDSEVQKKWAERYKDAREKDTAHVDIASLGVIYINPGALRSESRALVRPVHEAPGGIGALLQWGGDFKSAATQYELHSLIRARALRSPLLDGDIDVTTRGLPLVGELFAHFGAFLGRPFREYDFYVGVYDAMHFAAAASLCAHHTEGMTDEECVRDGFLTLLKTLELGCPASQIVARMFEWDHGLNRGESVGVPLGGCSPEEERHRWLIEKIIDAQQTPAGRDTSCTGDNIRRLMCAGGFANLLAALNKAGVRDSIKTWADTRPCNDHAGRADSVAKCFVDFEFRKLIRNPPGTATRLALVLLERTPAIEEAARVPSLPDGVHDGTMEAAYVLGYSSLEPSRRGPDADPSTVPNGGRSLGRTLAHFVPYSFGARVDRYGFEVAYRPTYYWEKWEVVAPLRFTRFSRLSVDSTTGFSMRGSAGPPRIHAYETVELGFGRRIYKSILSDLYVAAGPALRPGLRDVSLADRLYYELTADVLMSHVRVTAFMLPRFIESRRIGVSIGLNDVNGVLYWIAR
jgi:predicted acylesterase/phospholipase RssA